MENILNFQYVYIYWIHCFVFHGIFKITFLMCLLNDSYPITYQRAINESDSTNEIIRMTFRHEIQTVCEDFRSPNRTHHYYSGSHRTLLLGRGSKKNERPVFQWGLLFASKLEALYGWCFNFKHGNPIEWPTLYLTTEDFANHNNQINDLKVTVIVVKTWS